MRKELGKDLGVRKRFSATVARFGKRVNFKGYTEETILLTQVCEAGSSVQLTGHLWIPFSQAFEKARVNPGDKIEFDARVKEYKKGYVNKAMGAAKQTSDFKLSHPTRIIVIKNPN